MKTPSKIAGLGLALLAVLLTSGCVSIPSGPGVMVLPGSGKNFDQFRVDDMECRQYASSQVGGSTPDNAAGDSVARSAALGTVIGAAAGAIAGGHNSVAAGAATGLLFGSAMGAAAGSSSQYTLQQRYDIGYTQCMYTKGHKIPTAGRFDNRAGRPVASTYTPPPPPPANAPPPPSAAGTIPPPPPGSPPPPPPGVK